MTFDLVLAVMVVLAACGIATWMIWKWGPGERNRRVWCPVYKKTRKDRGFAEGSGVHTFLCRAPDF